MIKYRFLYFKTLTDFQSKLSEIDRQSIVFIQDKKLIWTHGQYYGEVPEAITIDSELSNLSINPVQNNVVKRAIDTLYNNIQSINNDVQYVKNAIDNDTEETLRKFQVISEFLESIQNTDSGEALNNIINIINAETQRATTAEGELSDDIEDVQDEVVLVKNQIQDLESRILSIRNAVNNIYVPEYSAASEDRDGLMTKEYVQQLNNLSNDLSLLNTELNNCNESIENLQSIISDTGQIDDIINKYNNLAQLIDDIFNEESSEDDPNAALNNILSNISNLQQQITDEVTRATTSEGQLNSKIDILSGRVRVLEDRPTSTNVVEGDVIKHVFTTLEEYQALTSYQDNTIYFILEPEVKTNWTFGGTFPIIFYTGLGTFPIKLS